MSSCVGVLVCVPKVESHRKVSKHAQLDIMSFHIVWTFHAHFTAWSSGRAPVWQDLCGRCRQRKPLAECCHDIVSDRFMVTRSLRNDPAVLFLPRSCHVLLAQKPALLLCLVTSFIHRNERRGPALCLPRGQRDVAWVRGGGHNERRGAPPQRNLIEIYLQHTADWIKAQLPAGILLGIKRPTVEEFAAVN